MEAYGQYWGYIVVVQTDYKPIYFGRTGSGLRPRHDPFASREEALKLAHTLACKVPLADSAPL